MRLMTAFLLTAALGGYDPKPPRRREPRAPQYGDPPSYPLVTLPQTRVYPVIATGDGILWAWGF